MSQAASGGGMMPWRRKFGRGSVNAQPGPYDTDFPTVDPLHLADGEVVQGVALQRRVTGPATAELRVLVQVNNVWHVAIGEACVGNISVTADIAGIGGSEAA